MTVGRGPLRGDTSDVRDARVDAEVVPGPSNGDVRLVGRAPPPERGPEPPVRGEGHGRLRNPAEWTRAPTRAPGSPWWRSESRLLQRIDDIADAVPVAGERQAGAEGIFPVEWLAFGLERKQQMSSRDHDPRQLLERLDSRCRGVWMIEYQQTAPASSPDPDGKCIEFTPDEFDVGMCGTCNGEHRRGDVHADDVEAMIGQEGRHATWSATDIGNPPDGLFLDQVDERPEQRPVDGVLCRRVEFGAGELDIRPGSHVVDGSGGRHMVIAGHAASLGGHRPPKAGRVAGRPILPGTDRRRTSHRARGLERLTACPGRLRPLA